jgi:hypothetical protein
MTSIHAKLERARMGAAVVRRRNLSEGDAGLNHWELWLSDLDGYMVVIASPDGSAGSMATYPVTVT